MRSRIINTYIEQYQSDQFSAISFSIFVNQIENLKYSRKYCATNFRLHEHSQRRNNSYAISIQLYIWWNKRWYQSESRAPGRSVAIISYQIVWSFWIRTRTSTLLHVGKSCREKRTSFACEKPEQIHCWSFCIRALVPKQFGQVVSGRDYKVKPHSGLERQ